MGAAGMWCDVMMYLLLTCTVSSSRQLQSIKRGDTHGSFEWQVSESMTTPGTLFPSKYDMLQSDSNYSHSPPPPAAIALFSLDQDEGVAYVQIERTESWEKEAGSDRDHLGDGGEADGEGWVEVYQEGHRLMANFSGSELSVAVGPVDTYLWASVYDGRGRWVGQSNVLHTGHHAGISLEVDNSVSRRVWVDGEELWFDLHLELHAGAEQQTASTIIVLIDNQTVGVMRLDMTLQPAKPRHTVTYRHHGQVEVGRHSVHAALLQPQSPFPTVLSAQHVIQYSARAINVSCLTCAVRSTPPPVSPTADARLNTERQRFASKTQSVCLASTAAVGESGAKPTTGLSNPKLQGGGGAWRLAADESATCSREAFSECVAHGEARIPPNRQYTEVLDAIDLCIARHCPKCGVLGGVSVSEAVFDAEREAPSEALLDAVREALFDAVDRHFSAVLADFAIAENLLRAGRALYILGRDWEVLRVDALRSWKTVHRLVGMAAPKRAQCTYPGCNELPKDICNLLNRLHHARAHTHNSTRTQNCLDNDEESYSRHFLDLVPAGDKESAAAHKQPAAAHKQPAAHSHSSVTPSTPSTARVNPPAQQSQRRYRVQDLVVGCLTTHSTYASRARTVAATWWRSLVAEQRHFYGDVPDADLPITPYLALDARWAGADHDFLRKDIMAADYGSSLPKFFIALLDMFLRHPNRSWYLLVGDDNFLVPRHLLELLDDIDADDKYVVGGPIGQHVGIGNYASGGSGLLFSNGFLQAAWRHLGPFAAAWRQGRGQYMLCHPCADVAFGFFVRDIGAVTVEVKCMHGMWPEYFGMHSSVFLPACAAMKDPPRVQCQRPATFHYLQPRAMLLLSRHFFGKDLDEGWHSTTA